MQQTDTSLPPARLVLADQHATVREGLCALFARLPDVEVVAQAADAASALEHAMALRPDVVVLDVALPGGQGVETIERLHTVSPPPAVIVLTPHEDPDLVREALAAGTAGYVLMRSGFAVLREAVQAVLRGERYVDPALAGRMEDAQGAARAASARELEVLRRAARGQSHKAIASALAISARTVEAHKRHGMRKLGLHGRRDLLRYALARHWLAEP